MRLFLTIPLPKDITTYVKALQSRLPRDTLRMPESLHITLQFFGDVDEDRLKELKVRLSKVHFSRFELTLDAVQAFPGWDAPRVLWIGVTPQEAVRALHDAVGKALEGMFSDDERFVAHITLARVRDTLDAASIASVKALPIEQRAFSVDKAVLYRSVLQGGGPVYTELLSVPSR